MIGEEFGNKLEEGRNQEAIRAGLVQFGQFGHFQWLRVFLLFWHFSLMVASPIRIPDHSQSMGIF